MSVRLLKELAEIAQARASAALRLRAVRPARTSMRPSMSRITIAITIPGTTLTMTTVRHER